MGRSILHSLFLGALLVIALGSLQAARSQDFPYSVPQAPEFDDRGNAVDSRDADSSAPRARSRRQGSMQSADTGVDYRTVRPYAPQPGPQQISVPAAPSVGPIPFRPSAQGPGPQPSESGPGAPPPPQAQAMPDCSHFPQIIAQSRSEQDMQVAAREYLTCLLQSGWNMELAKKHVIGTIETTYRLAR
jgi:hypothetical protein